MDKEGDCCYQRVQKGVREGNSPTQIGLWEGRNHKEGCRWAVLGRVYTPRLIRRITRSEKGNLRGRRAPCNLIRWQSTPLTGCSLPWLHSKESWKVSFSPAGNSYQQKKGISFSSRPLLVPHWKGLLSPRKILLLVLQDPKRPLEQQGWFMLE